jgi:hypothetical protein
MAAAVPISREAAVVEASRVRHIDLDAKQTGERRAGNPHAAFDVAGTENVAWSRCCDTRGRKGEKTWVDLYRRVSPRPCL